MTTQAFANKYAQLLDKQGSYVVTVKGVDWYEYSGFMIPAYLPHCTPPISEAVAKEVLKISARPFVRWDSRFGEVENSQWWYILKRGPWAVEDMKDKKKRWMIRQGKKQFSARLLTPEEIVSKCPNIAQLASERYKGQAKVESQQALEKRIEAAQKVPGVLEYLGCFYEDTLVSYSENYIQNNAVWLAIIRHDPAFLNKYSSYGFMDGILDYYLNRQKMNYVLDGCRSIHHRTEFQEHLIKMFGFTKEYAILNVEYSTNFKLLVNTAYPLKKAIWFISNRWVNSFSDNVAAVLRQENIRRACLGI